jgi:hypothetical protein
LEVVESCNNQPREKERERERRRRKASHLATAADNYEILRERGEDRKADIFP